ncbi:hypothetical protein DID80_07910 [Candidatus Marinamargulisbacteria bacterium SCGC AAA071-K20]|nr:hypothetical protein DID80_07910 [Candidatus Marinamargulisbacteria bacterium SCGC AAA071-K20]
MKYSHSINKKIIDPSSIQVLEVYKVLTLVLLRFTKAFHSWCFGSKRAIVGKLDPDTTKSVLSHVFSPYNPESLKPIARLLIENKGSASDLENIYYDGLRGLENLARLGSIENLNKWLINPPNVP